MIKLAINGFGRIGRHTFKVALKNPELEVVAVNDLTDPRTLAHLLKYDTAYPEFAGEVSFDEENLIINGKKIRVFAEKEPENLPWGDLGIDVVVESTGVFKSKEEAGRHLKAGAKRVIISAPAKGEEVSTYLRGVNDEQYEDQEIIDNASCTTNCAAPVIRVLNDIFGVEKAFLTTVHSYTADQRLQDAPHKDLRRARAAAQNMVPTSTGAAIATTKAIPELEGKFDGISIRVPTLSVSLTDFVAVLKKDATVEEINKAFTEASQGYLKDILAVTNEPLVSSDYIGNSHSAIVDLEFTNVVGGNLVKVLAWYDNEWGYANRLVEMVEQVGKKLQA
ncbi:MAG: type I glyceraldehyde-3-phosphate dehydrogenase [Candidatus Magasanikbacteria bacterium CG_4_9_14_3_um_filter_32_9]|uniref:Type I glyceraldehyde-3-phosphate dehydrogenase n=1 Tax=Candidatus Magasanikbacteria bacterium CG_4_9_14_3_um_filter_32_9 TaxID=1974644 RepID=A0A2M7Z6L9_9BACT|nr:MAG: type I glyceraldehyde-3-phosphate dehydrogenase [Candidatus Magasanikbacteria bacterium CG_4_9_14_3_um_filter_32_9]